MRFELLWADHRITMVIPILYDHWCSLTFFRLYLCITILREAISFSSVVILDLMWSWSYEYMSSDQIICNDQRTEVSSNIPFSRIPVAVYRFISSRFLRHHYRNDPLSWTLVHASQHESLLETNINISIPKQFRGVWASAWFQIYKGSAS